MTEDTRAQGTRAEDTRSGPRPAAPAPSTAAGLVARGKARGPRKDQLRNRTRLLEAARTAFIDRGPDISIEAIAREADVGPTTFYRHFPTKDDLVDALMDDLADGSAEVGADAAQIEDPWEAFTMVFIQGCVLGDSDLLLFESLSRATPHAAERGHQMVARLIEPVLERAAKAGLLRADLSVDDVATFMRMTTTGSTSQRATAKRLMLEGLRGEAERR